MKHKNCQQTRVKIRNCDKSSIKSNQLCFRLTIYSFLLKFKNLPSDFFIAPKQNQQFCHHSILALEILSSVLQFKNLDLPCCRGRKIYSTHLKSPPIMFRDNSIILRNTRQSLLQLINM